MNASLWDYTHSDRLASEEDSYFRDHPLFRVDADLLAARWTRPGPLVDLGCGAGRLALGFAARGFPVTAVDLSRPMLERVRAKATSDGLTVRTVRANLCDLALRDRTYRYALAMFSTMGMIRGAAPRRRALREAARVLEVGGVMALHAHNFWLNLFDPHGRRWLLDGALGRRRDGADLGDRRMTYRGIPAMEVHLYRFSELRRDLVDAGFAIEQVVPLDAATSEPISSPWFLPGVRAGGWIVFARRAS